jgi:hypothetical protein
VPVETQTRGRFSWPSALKFRPFPANFSVFSESQLEVSRWPGSKAVASFGKTGPRLASSPQTPAGRRRESRALAKSASTLSHGSPVVSTVHLDRKVFR